ncbi:MAG: bifunctional molybdenum cofactor biosynthesis protein MoaC/MoaB [Candidatus Azosocius agrarius]|nr:MAG: bifunctional molybdenum cofactor biosynthesis protein MoaC/MoaB [Gammaproteobacteria bacterium]
MVVNIDNFKNSLVSSLYSMINISDKNFSYRRSIAVGSICLNCDTYKLILEKKVLKGDPLILAEVAGIIAVKKTHDLIPLCHPILLEEVKIFLVMNDDIKTIDVYCYVSTTSKTGVEMEALTGVSVSLLTIYDLVKMYSAYFCISNIKLLFKDGGKNGLWLNDNIILPHFLKNKLDIFDKYLLDFNIIVIIISDRASNGIYEDKSAEILKNILQKLGAKVIYCTIIYDNEILIIKTIKDLVKKYNVNCIITSGGTGITSKDLTVNAIKLLCDYCIPGFGEILRFKGELYNKYSWLSRCLAAVYKDILIVTFPGSPKSISECLLILKHILPHSLKMINKK